MDIKFTSTQTSNDMNISQRFTQNARINKYR